MGPVAARGGFRLVVNHLYYDSDKPASSGFAFDADVLLRALQNIYAKRGKQPTFIEANLLREFTNSLDLAVTEGFSPSDPDDDFYKALRHSDEVFAAFKTHRFQRDIAARLLDADGNLKTFSQWVNDIQPIASHQCRAWFQTEYDTAVIRAHQAADWQQFQRESDVLPNLKWMPSTSAHPRADHRIFWGTIRPIDDPFWKQHRPGDRWNCKCSLSSTDEPPTGVPDGIPASSQPQPGLSGNPGQDRATFSQDHPYFPSSCAHCDFYKPSLKDRLRFLFQNRVKDCYNCPYINGCIDRAKEKQTIDNEAWKEKRKAIQDGLMPIGLEKDYPNLTTGTIHLSGKVRRRFLEHLHHDYDVDAAIYLWSHIEKLNYVRISPLGEGKDMTVQKNINNINRKKERGVVGYVLYRLSHKGRTFLVKTEKLKYGKEQLYTLYEE